MHPRTRADLILMSITVLWGSTFAVVKDTLTLVPPFFFLTLRFGLAFLAVLLIFPNRLKDWDWPTVRAGIILGLLLFIGFAFQTIGLAEIPATRSAFLTGLVVIFVPFIAYFRLKERMTLNLVAGALLALLGLYLLNRPHGWTVRWGDLATILCAWFFAWQLVYINIYTPRFAIPHLITVQFGVSTVAGLVLTVLFEKPPLAYPPKLWGSVLLMGLLATALAFYLQNRFQKDTTTVRAAIIYNLEQIFAVLFAFLLLGEVLEVSEYLGGAAIIGGVLVAEVGKGRSTVF